MKHTIKNAVISLDAVCWEAKRAIGHNISEVPWSRSLELLHKRLVNDGFQVPLKIISSHGTWSTDTIPLVISVLLDLVGDDGSSLSLKIEKSNGANYGQDISKRVDRRFRESIHPEVVGRWETVVRRGVTLPHQG